ncbi:MAG TPA: FtsX-like permease family protein [Lentisphaeria bacterium]|nr:FtsX-like permease family protein [Lentisphaeria bacterium]
MKLGTVALKYAARSLTRHTRRTLISMAGVGVGCAMALIALSWMSGAFEMQIRAIAESGAGHLMVVHRDWEKTRENTLRLTDWQETLEAVRAHPGIRACSARARANGLLAFGNRSAGAQIMAVLPEDEFEVSRIISRSRMEGHYLEDEEIGAVVIGKALARRLNVELDDDLYASLTGKDDIHSAMLRIAGIIDTGSQDLDLTICHVTVATMESIIGAAGAGEISILLKEQSELASVQKSLGALMTGDNTVVSWREVQPALSAGMDGDVALMRLLTAIVITVVALGIASAQLTAVLERRTEFAVLSALGMKGSQITGMVLIESLIIGIGGALIALALGGLAAWYLATEGINLAYFVEDFTGPSDILLDPYIYGSFGPWLIGYALSISIIATVVASLYPAWKASHIAPAEALRTQ